MANVICKLIIEHFRCDPALMDDDPRLIATLTITSYAIDFSASSEIVKIIHEK